MEELTETLATSFQVSNVPNSTAAAHPRFSQYKSKVNPSQCQVIRRQKLLELQKQKRYDYVNHARRLAENDWSLDIRDDGNIFMDEESWQNETEMEWIAQYCKPPRFYKNQLMLSEWLVEVPDDLASEWFSVLCPEGKRSLVVAAKGKTIAYSKSGCRVNTFPSFLPGGNRQHLQSASYTLLDCVFDIQRRTYYVLDVLCWKGHPVLDSDTEFRFYWLHTKLSEIPDVQKQAKLNPYSFVPLPYFHCTKEELNRIMSSPLPFEASLDGILFYHKKSHYLHGVSPLVGWLKAYMLPEVLDVNVPSHYEEQKPKNYTSFSQHLKVAIDKVKQRKCQMECEESPTENANSNSAAAAAEMLDDET